MQTTEYFGLRDKNVMESLFPILAEQWLTPLARRFGDGYAYSRNYAWRGPCDWGALLGDEHLHNCWGMPTYPTDRWLVGGIEFAVAIVPRIKEWIQDCYTEDRCVYESYVPISGHLLDHLQKMDHMGLNVLILSYTAYSSSPIRIIRPSDCAEVQTHLSAGDDTVYRIPCRGNGGKMLSGKFGKRSSCYGVLSPIISIWRMSAGMFPGRYLRS